MKTNEKKIYENAEMEIVAVDNNDVICTSPSQGTGSSSGIGSGSLGGFDFGDNLQNPDIPGLG